MALIKEIASFTPGYSHTNRIEHFLYIMRFNLNLSMKYTIPGKNCT